MLYIIANILQFRQCLFLKLFLHCVIPVATKFFVDKFGDSVTDRTCQFHIIVPLSFKLRQESGTIEDIC